MIRRLAVAALIALSGCREGPAEFRVPPPDTLTDVGGRLTYNVKDDRAPAWNGTSDSVLYSAESYPPYPIAKGFLFTMSAHGGKVQPLVAPVQIGPARQPWLSAPVLSPNRTKIAFVELTDTVEHPAGLSCPGGSASFSEPVLDSALLRVRKLTGAAPDEATIPIKFEGVTIDDTQHPFFLAFITVEVVHPYHRQFTGYRLPLYRPAWSPDGTRIAYSDGLHIRVWTIGQPNSVVLAGSDDGISPSWSPDGTRIAFVRLPRGAPSTFDCVVRDRNFNVVALYRRTVYGTDLQSGELMVVNADGTQLRDLGFGYTPTWTADSREIVAARFGNLWRIPVDGSAPTAVPETAGAFEPAISPDGKWLAFTRSQAAGSNDVWIAQFR